MGVLDFGDVGAARLEENRSGKNQNRRVYKECQVQSNGTIKEVQFQRPPDSFFISLDLSGLNQGRVEIQVVRHHGSPYDTDGDVEGGIIWNMWDKSFNNLTHLRFGKEDLDGKGDPNDGYQANDKSFHLSHAETLQHQE